MLTENQLRRLKLYNQLVGKYWFKQMDCPDWLLPVLDRLLGNSCPFHKVKHFKGALVMYVPVLCHLNPFYDSLIEYRANKEGVIPKF